MDIHKLSHTHDPETSKIAVRTLDSTGGRSGHGAIVLNAVQAHPGLTACELMAHTGNLGEYQVRRRLTDLKNQGLVAYGPTRVCTIKGTPMKTWNIPHEGQGELF